LKNAQESAARCRTSDSGDGVVGDSKQLPPTAFFQRSASDDAVVDENDYTELESILDEAIASGLREQMLGWQYRSRPEALIEFSNAS